MNIHPSLIPEYRGPEPVYERSLMVQRAPVSRPPSRAKGRLGPDPGAERGSRKRFGHRFYTLTRKLAAVGVDLLPQAVEALLADDPATSRT